MHIILVLVWASVHKLSNDQNFITCKIFLELIFPSEDRKAADTAHPFKLIYDYIIQFLTFLTHSLTLQIKKANVAVVTKTNKSTKAFLPVLHSTNKKVSLAWWIKESTIFTLSNIWNPYDFTLAMHTVHNTSRSSERGSGSKNRVRVWFALRFLSELYHRVAMV